MRCSSGSERCNSLGGMMSSSSRKPLGGSRLKYSREDQDSMSGGYGGETKCREELCSTRHYNVTKRSRVCSSLCSMLGGSTWEVCSSMILGRWRGSGERSSMT